MASPCCAPWLDRSYYKLPKDKTFVTVCIADISLITITRMSRYRIIAKRRAILRHRLDLDPLVPLVKYSLTKPEPGSMCRLYPNFPYWDAIQSSLAQPPDRDTQMSWSLAFSRGVAMPSPSSFWT